MTQEGRILGTVNYMSPEQAEGKPVDARSDVFSLGVLLYQMTTGQVPFQGDTPISTITAIMRDNPISLTDLNQGLPRHLDRVVKRCLAKDPGRRYQSAVELRNELEHLKEEVDSGAHGEHLAAAAGAAAGAPAASTPGLTSGMRHSGLSAPSVHGVSGISGVSGVDHGAPPARKKPWLAIGIAAAVLVIIAVAGSIWLGSRMSSDGGAREGAEAGARAGRGSGRTVAAVNKNKRMIAVLPFDNLGSQDEEYFAVGITEEITSRLAGVDGLGVISRKSAQQYAGSEKSLQDIGRELGVDYVLEGSVRWARTGGGQSNRVRITPQLVDVEADTNVWSEVFDREIDDVFEIQSEIARRVADQLGGAMLGSSAGYEEEHPTEVIEAYHAFLRGNYYIDSPAPTPEALRKAIDHYQRAVELDPRFAEAWGRLSAAHSFLYHLGGDVSEERRAASRHALEQCARLAPGSGDEHLARGFYLYWGYKDYEPALEEFRLAADLLTVRRETALLGQAYIVRRLARFDEAIALFEEVVATNPRDAHLLWDVAETMTYARRYAEAIAVADESLAIQPADNVSGYVRAYAIWMSKGHDGLSEARRTLEAMPAEGAIGFYRGYGFWQRIFEGRPEEALEFLRLPPAQEWVRQPEASVPTRLYEAIALELAGRKNEARVAYGDAVALLDAEIKRTPDDYRLYGSLGLALAGLGRRDDALAAANRGLEMLPPEKDALIGPQRLLEVALVHAHFGEAAEAVGRLERLLAFSGAFSVPFMEMQPGLDPIRKSPEYRALVD